MNRTTPAMRSTLALLTTALALLAGAPAGAQTLTGITLDPTTGTVGQPVKLTANFDVSNDNINCNVRIRWGDGAEDNFHVNQTKDVPLVLSHTYAAAGSFEVKVEPKNNLPALKCLGKSQKTMLTVAAPAPAKAASAAAHTGKGPVCPAGWRLSGKAEKKNGTYTCSAKPGTALPEPKPVCPGDLTYFENAKKGLLGCQK